MTSNIAGRVSEMRESKSENSEMSSVEFAQYALRERVAPPGAGVNVSDRIRVAARRLGWTHSRTKDAWYADPRISINADELRDIENAAGLRYGKQEHAELNEIIWRAEALLDGNEADFYRPFVDAVRAMARAFSGSRTPGE
jgi:hypothetical protein